MFTLSMPSHFTVFITPLPQVCLSRQKHLSFPTFSFSNRAICFKKLHCFPMTFFIIERPRLHEEHTVITDLYLSSHTA